MLSCESGKLAGTGPSVQTPPPEAQGDGRVSTEGQPTITIDESFEEAVVFSLAAKDTVKWPLHIGSNAVPPGATILKASLPPGASLKADDLIFHWPSDLEDIGATLLGSVGIRHDGVQGTVDLAFHVSSPVTTTHVCSALPDPVIGDVKPILKWHWKGYTNGDATRYATTYSAPVAGDINKDGVVDIVTVASKIFPEYSYLDVNGALVVLNGKTGAVEWNALAESNIQIESSTTPAIADLDGDGWGEIIAVSKEGASRAILIIDMKTKSVRAAFRDDFQCGVYCMPAVGDLNGDGQADISAGNVVLNANGSLNFRLVDAAGNPPVQLLRRNTTTLAELDKDSLGLEIIVNGSQVYSSAGKLLWKGDCGGASAVADLDRNGMAELVCIGDGKVNSYSSKGVLNWSRDIPQVTPIEGLRGGAPNIGNFNSDAELEIGTAGGDYYVVYNSKGEILWRVLTTDRSSHGTGSTVFDFNGDGKVEVVYNDEYKLRIYAGDTGTVLFETDNRSGTLWEYPLIVNIDDDPSVEIVVSAPGDGTNNLEQGGIRVYDDPSNKWVSSRKIWNQYNYYPEIVEDNLQVRKNPPIPASGFRVNAQGAIKRGDRILLPDAAMIASNFGSELKDGSPQFVSLLQNTGEAPLAAGIRVQLRVALEDGTPGEVLGERVSVGEVGAGKDLVVVLPLTRPLEGAGDYILQVNLDDTGNPIVRECDGAANNTLRFKLQGAKR